jgi:hypothetical protein
MQGANPVQDIDERVLRLIIVPRERLSILPAVCHTIYRRESLGCSPESRALDERTKHHRHG